MPAAFSAAGAGRRQKAGVAKVSPDAASGAGGDKAGTTRLFIALAVPQKTRSAIKFRTSALRHSLRHIRWEASEKFHVTLRFLGQTRCPMIPEISAAMRACCGTFTPFTLRTAGVEVLLRRRHSGVLVVSLEPSDVLSDLKDALDERLRAIGIEPERQRFIPHITVARAKKRVKLTMPPEFELDFEARRVALMESKLRKEGALYTEINSIEIG